MEMNINKCFTTRAVAFEGWSDTIAATVPLVRLTKEPLFASFSPFNPRERNPEGFVPEHIIRMKAGSNMVHEKILKLRLEGRWSARKQVSQETRFVARRKKVVSSIDTMNFWVEKDEDFILLKLAGLFANSQYESVERDIHRERKKVHRHLNFTVTERRRLLTLLRASIKKGGSSLAVDHALFAKID